MAIVNLSWIVTDGDDVGSYKSRRDQIEYKCDVTADVRWEGDKAVVKVGKVEVVEVVLYARPSFDRGMLVNADQSFLDSLVPYCVAQLEGDDKFEAVACKVSREYAEAC